MVHRRCDNVKCLCATTLISCFANKTALCHAQEVVEIRTGWSIRIVEEIDHSKEGAFLRPSTTPCIVPKRAIGVSIPLHTYIYVGFCFVLPLKPSPANGAELRLITDWMPLSPDRSLARGDFVDAPYSVDKRKVAVDRLDSSVSNHLSLSPNLDSELLASCPSSPPSPTSSPSADIILEHREEIWRFIRPLGLGSRSLLALARGLAFGPRQQCKASWICLHQVPSSSFGGLCCTSRLNGDKYMIPSRSVDSSCPSRSC